MALCNPAEVQAPYINHYFNAESTLGFYFDSFPVLIAYYHEEREQEGTSAYQDDSGGIIPFRVTAFDCASIMNYCHYYSQDYEVPVGFSPADLKFMQEHESID